jgi:hypothetical protein
VTALAAVVALALVGQKPPKLAPSSEPICIVGEIPGCEACIGGDTVACLNIASAFARDGANARRAVPLANWLCYSDSLFNGDPSTEESKNNLFSAGCVLLWELFSGDFAAQGLPKDPQRQENALIKGCFRFSPHGGSEAYCCLTEARSLQERGNQEGAAKFFREACEHGNKDGCEGAQLAAPQ